jgi:hypothetical protein
MKLQAAHTLRHGVRRYREMHENFRKRGNLPHGLAAQIDSAFGVLEHLARLAEQARNYGFANLLASMEEMVGHVHRVHVVLQVTPHKSYGRRRRQINRPQRKIWPRKIHLCPSLVF